MEQWLKAWALKLEGFPGSSADKEIACDAGPGFDSGVGKIPLEEDMVTHSSILAWRIPMDRGAWRATVHGVAKSRTRLSDLANLAQETDSQER